MKYEIVISCFRENLEWINEIPQDIDIVIYKKDKFHNPFPNGRKRKTKEYFLENVGREADTYLKHIVYNYNDLADYIIFSQGDPFYHCPNFIDLLKNKNKFSDLQPLSYLINLHCNVPPQFLLDSKNNKEEFVTNLKIYCPLVSFYTLQPIKFYDHGAGWVYSKSIDFLKIQFGEPTIKKFLYYADIKIDSPSSVGHWNMAACFGVSKNKILLHKRESYNKLMELNKMNSVGPYLCERSWMTIFGLV